jgi:hypothetical protein
MARERYVDQVRLLFDVLPAVAAEEDFALKGGTAINFQDILPVGKILAW